MSWTKSDLIFKRKSHDGQNSRDINVTQTTTTLGNVYIKTQPTCIGGDGGLPVARPSVPRGVWPHRVHATKESEGKQAFGSIIF